MTRLPRQIGIRVSLQTCPVPFRVGHARLEGDEQIPLVSGKALWSEIKKLQWKRIQEINQRSPLAPESPAPGLPRSPACGPPRQCTVPLPVPRPAARTAFHGQVATRDDHPGMWAAHRCQQQAGQRFERGAGLDLQYHAYLLPTERGQPLLQRDYIQWAVHEGIADQVGVLDDKGQVFRIALGERGQGQAAVRQVDALVRPQLHAPFPCLSDLDSSS